MTYKYRVLLVLFLTILIFCSQVIFGQSKTITKIVNIKDAKLKVELKYQKDSDCLSGVGSIDLNVSGGSGSYQYSWTGPNGFTASTEDIANAAPGVYAVQVSDANQDCTYSNSWTISNTCTSSCNLIAASSIINASACNQANGSISITSLSGGSGNYTYTWYDENYKSLATTKNLSGRLPGTYILFVQDVNSTNCNRYFYYSINSSFKLATTIITNSSCSSPYSGGINAVVTGGSGNYSYEWVNAKGVKKIAGSLLSAMPGGQYQVIVKDKSLGCKIQQSMIIPTSPTATLSVNSKLTPATKCIPADGAIDITVTQGSGNYVYNWFNQTKNQQADTKEDIVNSQAGNYTLVVSDTSSNCSAFKSFTIIDKVPAYPSLAASIANNQNCSVPFTGSILITPKGSSDSFSFDWTNGDNFKSDQKGIESLAPGDYLLKLTDTQTGCSLDSILTIKDESAPFITISTDQIKDVSACANPNGEIQITVNTNGNPPPYTLLWTGTNFTSTQEDLINLEVGTYMLTATIMCNRPPVIAVPEIQIGSHSSIKLDILNYITDADNNLDPSTMQVIQKPISGATAALEVDGMLDLDYTNVSFSGIDQFRIKACDLANACSENTVNIKIENGVVVYNAVAPHGMGDNKFMRINNLPAKNKVAIFNRWGDLVFEAENYDNENVKFSGLSNHGKELPSGTYFYKIEVANDEPITGYLALKE